MRAFLIALAAGTILAAFPCAATANQLELFGTSARTIAMAGAYSAIAEGSDALFYNPGALIQSDGLILNTSYQYTLPAMFLERQDDSGTTLDATQDTKVARHARSGQWVSAGFAVPLNKNLYVGLYSQVPLDGMDGRKWVAPNQPYFIDYEMGVFGLTMIPGFAVKFASNIGLGVGIETIMDGTGDQPIYIPTEVENIEASAKGGGRMGAQAAPVIGFFAKPAPQLRLGVSYHGESYRREKRKFDWESVPGIRESTVGVKYEVIYDFNPATLSFGAAYQPAERLLMSLDIVYEAWNRYFPPYPSLDLDFSELDQAGLTYTKPNIIDPKDVRPATHDTISPRFAIETRPLRNLTIDVGYKREPSCTSFQRGTASALDLDANVFSMGMGVRLGGAFADRVRLDGGIQGHFFSQEHATKLDSWMKESDPTTNPLYPRYEIGGRYFSGGFSATVNF